MAKRIPPEIKQRVKELYYEGTTCVELAAQFDLAHALVRSWASKEKWPRRLTIASKKLPLHERARAWMRGQIRDLEHTFEAIQSLPQPSTVKEAQAHEALMHEHLARGRKLFGLDQEEHKGQRSAVNINIMSGLNGRTVKHVSGVTVDEAIDQDRRQSRSKKSPDLIARGVNPPVTSTES